MAKPTTKEYKYNPYQEYKYNPYLKYNDFLTLIVIAFIFSLFTPTPLSLISVLTVVAVGFTAMLVFDGIKALSSSWAKGRSKPTKAEDQTPLMNESSNSNGLDSSSMELEGAEVIAKLAGACEIAKGDEKLKKLYQRAETVLHSLSSKFELGRPLNKNPQYFEKLGEARTLVDKIAKSKPTIQELQVWDLKLPYDNEGGKAIADLAGACEIAKGDEKLKKLYQRAETVLHSLSSKFELGRPLNKNPQYFEKLGEAKALTIEIFQKRPNAKPQERRNSQPSQGGFFDGSRRDSKDSKSTTPTDGSEQKPQHSPG